MRMVRAGGGLRRGALAAVLGCLWGVPAAAEETGGSGKQTAPQETLRSAEFGGVSIGMSVAELGWTLEANGFRPSQRARRRYVDDSGEVKRRIRYRELPGPDGTLTVYEIDETVWYPPDHFDSVAFEADLRKRFGEPLRVDGANIGRREFVFSEIANAPTVVEVIEACQKEIQEKDPEISAADAEAKASEAGQYRPGNDQIEQVCPKAAPLYREMAEALEAPRMTVVVRSARVDTMVRWPWVEAELIRRLGPEDAARVMAFGPDAVEGATRPAAEPPAEP